MRVLRHPRRDRPELRRVLARRVRPHDPPDVLLAVVHVVIVIRPRAAGAEFGCAFEGEGAGHRSAQFLAARLISSLPSSLAASAIGTNG
jgi:hypothetical protein